MALSCNVRVCTLFGALRILGRCLCANASTGKLASHELCELTDTGTGTGFCNISGSGTGTGLKGLSDACAQLHRQDKWLQISSESTGQMATVLEWTGSGTGPGIKVLTDTGPGTGMKAR